MPKVGALFGEAVIITAEKAKRDFRYSIKRQGGMRAKSHLLGIQFETLFHHGLKSESLRSKLKPSSLKTINKTYICKNKTNIYINKTIICTNITFIYTFLRSAAKYLPRFSKVSTAVVMILHAIGCASNILMHTLLSFTSNG